MKRINSKLQVSKIGTYSESIAESSYYDAKRAVMISDKRDQNQGIEIFIYTLELEKPTITFGVRHTKIINETNDTIYLQGVGTAQNGFKYENLTFTLTFEDNNFVRMIMHKNHVNKNDVYDSEKYGLKGNFELPILSISESTQNYYDAAQTHYAMNKLALAAEIYEKAADLNHPLAQYNIGCFYLQGIGVSKDINKAIEYLNKSANQGNGEAHYNLGVIYYEGTVVNKDLEKALNHFKTAAKEGVTDANIYIVKINVALMKNSF